MGRTIPDLVGPGLRVLFCGINPGLVSGERGAHFARPGNRFWKVLHAGGIHRPGARPRGTTAPPGLPTRHHQPGAFYVEGRSRPQPGAASGRRQTLERKVARLRPAFVAVLGMQAYRTAFGRPGASVGPQREGLAAACLWLLPNPSGLQARYGLAEMVAMYQELRLAAGVRVTPGP